MAKRSGADLRKTHLRLPRPDFACIALLLQGGGALGAFQGGVYAALAEAGLHPDWVAGISIGAVNAALIAGNAPGQRTARLREFWETITASPLAGWLDPGTLGAGAPGAGVLGAEMFQAGGELARGGFNQLAAACALAAGAPGFFAPRRPPPWLALPGTTAATSWYDTGELRRTLERLVDFERINAGGTRLSVGAVNVRSGNFVYFDSTTHRIGPEHVMASGALPPGFPAVEIEGEFYWDGGLVSNTPFAWMMEARPRRDTLAFQVDLWSARGELPRDLLAVANRQKEIQYSSRTRANTQQFVRQQRLRAGAAALLDRLPPELAASPEAQALRPHAERKVYSIVQLIYRARAYEGQSKDYEFSRLAMSDHWQAGYFDAVRTLRHPEIAARPDNIEGVRTFDLAVDGRE